MAAKTPHLSDLFNEGELLKVLTAGGSVIEVWVQRPDPGQMELVLKKARVERARRFHELTGPDSEEKIAVEGDVEFLTKEEVVDQLLARKRRDLEQQAFNDVLFSKETEEDSDVTEFGSYWGPEGHQWTDVLEATIGRMEEIEAHNLELRASGVTDGLLSTDEDEELERLGVVQEKFQNEVKVRYEELVDLERRDIGVQPVGDLRKTLIKERIDLDCESVWYTHYKYTQLYYAVRYPDAHEKLYFKDAGAIRALPRLIQDQIMECYDGLDVSGDQLKNLLTPLPS